MKYRRLDSEELQELEAEFIRFLASNSITGPDWEKLKTADKKKADGLIDVFSDLVFEKILKKVAFLEIKTPSDIKTFQCLEDKIKLLGLQVKGDSELDFTQNLDPKQMLSLLQLSGAKLQLYSAEKAYKNGDRALEIFNMMEGGCLISQGEIYKVLENMKGQEKE